MGKFRQLQPPMSLDDGLTMVFKRVLQLEDKVKQLKLEKGEMGDRGEKGSVGYMGPKGQTGTPGKKGDSGITTIKHIYEPLPKEIREKLGSLGQSDPDLEAKARLALANMEKMQYEIDELFKEKKKSILPKPKDPQIEKMKNEIEVLTAELNKKELPKKKGFWNKLLRRK